MSIPFLFFEMNFDQDLFNRKYGILNEGIAEDIMRHYQSIDKPGIYAVPEEEPEQQSEPTPEQLSSGIPDAQNNLPNDQQVVQPQMQIQPIQMPQLNPDEQKQLDQEIEPLKKTHLINQLYKLSYYLKNQFINSADLDLLLKYGVYLSYNVLKIAAMQIIAAIQQQAAQQNNVAQQNQVDPNGAQQNEAPVNQDGLISA